MTDGTSVSVHNGFPNAADDARLQPLDLHKLLVTNPYSTYLFRVQGNDWAEQGVYAGDIVVIDRALEPRRNDLLAVVHNDTFMLAPLEQIPPDSTQWGIVTSTIHRHRQSRADDES